MYTSHVILMLGAIEYYILACKPQDLNDYGVHVCLVAGDTFNEVEVQWILEDNTNKHSCLLTTSNLDNSTTETTSVAMSVNKVTVSDLSVGDRYQVEVDCCPFYGDCTGSAARRLRSRNLDFKQGAIDSDEILCTDRGYTQYFNPEPDFSSFPLIICAVHYLDHFTLIDWQTSSDAAVNNCSITYQYSDGAGRPELVDPSGYLMAPYAESILTVHLKCFNRTNHALSSFLHVSPDAKNKVCSNDVEKMPNFTTMNRINKVPDDNPDVVKTSLNDVASGIFMATAFMVLIALLMLILYRHRAYLQARQADRPLLDPLPVDDDEEGPSGMAEISL